MKAPRKAGSQRPDPVSTEGAASPASGAAEIAGVPDEVFEFVAAIDEYKRLNQRPFPTWS